MATNQLTATARTFHRTIAAGDTDVVTMPRSYSLVQIVNRSASSDPTVALWVTLDRGGNNETQTVTNPAVNGAGSFYVGPGGVLTLEDDPAGPPSVVRITAVTSFDYSVIGL